MRFFVCVIAMAMSMAAGNAFADAEAGQGYFSVMGSYVDDDKDRNVDEGPGLQIGFGKALNEKWNVEALYYTSRADTIAGEWKFQGFGLDFQRVFMRSERFSPYIHAGFGSMQAKAPGSRADNGGMVSAGLGFYINLYDSNAAVRAEWKVREDKATEISLTDNIVSVGVHLPFGDKRPKWVDSDNDGVSDSNDRCPNTPAGASVDASGCELDSDGDGVKDSMDQCPNTPAGVSVDSRGCPMDSDGDGVSDDKDQCPNTPAGATVDENGCELDSDGDGVVDRLDECPNTPAGVQVDIRGCEIKAEIVLRGVNFESNSDRLLAGAESVLADAAATLQKNPTIKVEVAGHTDSDGAAEYNEGLSARRAQTVHDYLARNGIAVDRMTVRGYGESQPVADNSTATGKAENRRVVLRITER
ncbi:MAG: OmpA family protein [Gammaproteobacteria bacterium]|nr:OmpA family protein [Gammaproteobacteria bacterium]